MEHVIKLTLDNGLEYYVVQELIYKNYKYVLLIQVENAKDMMIQKYPLKRNISFLEPLASNEEFDEMIILFQKVLLNKE